MRLYFNSLSLGVEELIKFIEKNLGRGWIARNIPQDPHWKLGPALSYNQPLLFGPKFFQRVGDRNERFSKRGLNK